MVHFKWQPKYIIFITTFEYIGVCINTFVYMYIHMYVYTYKYVFAIQVIKMGEGFCVFLIGEEILKTRNWNLLSFKLKKKKKIKLSAVEDGSSFLQPLWLTSSSLNELFFEELTNPRCLQSDREYSNGLASSSSCKMFKSTACVWIVDERFPWQCEEKILSIPLLLIHGLSVGSAYRRN